ncbi:PQQ-binding-like beta-propeller repeat protein [Candidatus Poribacteria bacterium]
MALLLSLYLAEAEDWPQWRGMDRSGVTAESSGYDEGGWPPTSQWTIDPGTGNSSPIIVGDLMYIMGNKTVEDRAMDTIYCLSLSDLDAGKSLEQAIVWSHSYKCSSGYNSGNDNLGGPSSTPTYDYNSGCLLTLSKMGHLKCFDNPEISGHIRWEKNLKKEYDPVNVAWDHNCSPLVLDGLVIVEVGDNAQGKNGYPATLVAFDVSDGKEVWHVGNSKGAASSPVALTVEGVKCVAIRSGGNKLWVVKASDGSVVADYSWSSNYSFPTLAVSGSKIFGTNSYNGAGSRYLNIKLASPGYDELINNKKIRSNVSSPIIWRDHVFCTDCPDGFNVHNKGPLKCMSLSGADMGQLKWTSADPDIKDVFGHGPTLLCAGDERIMALNAYSHNLVLVDADPSKSYADNRLASTVLAEIPVSPKHTRTDPGYTYTMVLANGKLYVRPQGGKVYCYSVAGSGSDPEPNIEQ